MFAAVGMDAAAVQPPLDVKLPIASMQDLRPILQMQASLDHNLSECF